MVKTLLFSPLRILQKNENGVRTWLAKKQEASYGVVIYQFSPTPMWERLILLDLLLVVLVGGNATSSIVTPTPVPAPFNLATSSSSLSALTNVALGGQIALISGGDVIGGSPPMQSQPDGIGAFINPDDASTAIVTVNHENRPADISRW